MHGFFSATIILVFGGLFLRFFSQNCKFKFRCMKVLTDKIAKNNCEAMRKHPKADQPNWKARNNPPKRHTLDVTSWFYITT